MAEDEMVSNITNSMDINLSKPWEVVKDREAWHDSVHGVAKSRTRLMPQQKQPARPSPPSSPQATEKQIKHDVQDAN